LSFLLSCITFSESLQNRLASTIQLTEGKEREEGEGGEDEAEREREGEGEGEGEEEEEEEGTGTRREEEVRHLFADSYSSEFHFVEVVTKQNFEWWVQQKDFALVFVTAECKSLPLLSFTHSHTHTLTLSPSIPLDLPIVSGASVLSLPYFLEIAEGFHNGTFFLESNQTISFGVLDFPSQMLLAATRLQVISPPFLLLFSRNGGESHDFVGSLAEFREILNFIRRNTRPWILGIQDEEGMKDFLEMEEVAVFGSFDLRELNMERSDEGGTTVSLKVQEEKEEDNRNGKKEQEEQEKGEGRAEAKGEAEEEGKCKAKEEAGGESSTPFSSSDSSSSPSSSSTTTTSSSSSASTSGSSASFSLKFDLFSSFGHHFRHELLFGLILNSSLSQRFPANRIYLKKANGEIVSTEVFQESYLRNWIKTLSDRAVVSEASLFAVVSTPLLLHTHTHTAHIHTHHSLLFPLSLSYNSFFFVLH
jgi:hypothetical protein